MAGGPGTEEGGAMSGDLLNGWPEDGEPDKSSTESSESVDNIHVEREKSSTKASYGEIAQISKAMKKLTAFHKSLKAEVEELQSYLDEEKEKNEIQVRMTMDAYAEIERLRADVPVMSWPLTNQSGTLIEKCPDCVAKDAEIERLKAVVEHCAVVRLCSKCAAALEDDDE